MVLRVWNAGTGQQLLTLPHPNGIYNVAFLLDGKRVAELLRKKGR